MPELNWFTVGYFCGAASMLMLALFVSWWVEREDTPKRTRDEDRILEEALGIMERRLVSADHAINAGADRDPHSAALGIGAAVLPPDASPGSGEGATDVHRSRGRVLRPASWLVDDCAPYGHTTWLIIPPIGKDRIH